MPSCFSCCRKPAVKGDANRYESSPDKEFRDLKIGGNLKFDKFVTWAKALYGKVLSDFERENVDRPKYAMYLLLECARRFLHDDDDISKDSVLADTPAGILVNMHLSAAAFSLIDVIENFSPFSLDIVKEIYDEFPNRNGAGNGIQEAESILEDEELEKDSIRQGSLSSLDVKKKKSIAATTLGEQKQRTRGRTKVEELFKHGLEFMDRTFTIYGFQKRKLLDDHYKAMLKILIGVGCESAAVVNKIFSENSEKQKQAISLKAKPIVSTKSRRYKYLKKEQNFKNDFNSHIENIEVILSTFFSHPDKSLVQSIQEATDAATDGEKKDLIAHQIQVFDKNIRYIANTFNNIQPCLSLEKSFKSWLVEGRITPRLENRSSLQKEIIEDVGIIKTMNLRLAHYILKLLRNNHQK